jgi:hypothetical protein
MYRKGISKTIMLAIAVGVFCFAPIEQLLLLLGGGGGGPTEASFEYGELPAAALNALTRYIHDVSGGHPESTYVV